MGRILDNLSRIFKRNPTGELKFITEAIDNSLGTLSVDIDLYQLEFIISTSTGKWLDEWGSWFGVARILGEDDTAYRNRILAVVSKPKNTIPALISIIKTYYGDPNAQVIVYEPYTNIRKFNVSTFSGTDVYENADYYKAGVVDIIIPQSLTDSVIATINQAKSAGIKVYFTRMSQFSNGTSEVKGQINFNTGISSYIGGTAYKWVVADDSKDTFDTIKASIHPGLSYVTLNGETVFGTVAGINSDNYEVYIVPSVSFIDPTPDTWNGEFLITPAVQWVITAPTEAPRAEYTTETDMQVPREHTGAMYSGSFSDRARSGNQVLWVEPPVVSNDLQLDSTTAEPMESYETIWEMTTPTPVIGQPSAEYEYIDSLFLPRDMSAVMYAGSTVVINTVQTLTIGEFEPDYVGIVTAVAATTVTKTSLTFDSGIGQYNSGTSYTLTVNTASRTAFTAMADTIKPWTDYVTDGTGSTVKLGTITSVDKVNFRITFTAVKALTDATPTTIAVDIVVTS